MSQKSKYSIIMPPPNITGILHMGHVLNMTIQDVLIRKAKNDGKEVLWLPGLDHAAIATESKVIDYLKKKGIKKSDLSREKFLEYCWEWKEKYGNIILEQIKKLECLCDWDKIHFTLDADASKTVIDTFIKLYNEGYIYRSTKMINWDVQNKTALSDEEVIYRDTKSILYYLKYKIKDSNDEYLTIATSRPETIFGDVAICVNPNDERYKHIIGKKVIVPLVNRIIPVISDEYVKKDFGTGCLKITPAHDFNDYNIGEKYNLEKLNILNQDGTLNDKCGEYSSLDRFEARKKIKKDLLENNLLEKEEIYDTRIGFSERTNTVVEPRLSQQWFIKMKELSIQALEAVINGEINFTPNKFVNIYKSWMENIQDWCISRQLWWGHRIPVYYYENMICAAHDINEAFDYFKQKNKNINISDIKQEEDVLDTWFSAALWPEIVTECVTDLPTSDLVTGPDIIFFWVARMIIMSYYLKHKPPFKNVYFTGIIRDNKGRKMSKSLGNSPDPLQLIEQYGYGGVRLGILLSTQAGNDLKFDEKLCKQGRNFITKIKNAYRLLNIWKEQVGNINLEEAKEEYSKGKCSKQNIINELKDIIDSSKQEIEKKFKEYRINEAAMIAYKLFWDVFCSRYLELAKTLDIEKWEKTCEEYSKIINHSNIEKWNEFCNIYSKNKTIDIKEWNKICNEYYSTINPSNEEKWNEFCDKYYEIIKYNRLKKIDKSSVGMFLIIFDDLVKILDPFIPNLKKII